MQRHLVSAVDQRADLSGCDLDALDGGFAGDVDQCPAIRRQLGIATSGRSRLICLMTPEARSITKTW
ncbi:hypothetical protein [Saccharopolyspora mangrovi]|uniref:Uncharacterized protein n=1 Tax=Saccharopolyspora mangrovi TaxID=3082379 RepID=A0ABU6AKV3_9PSEU|nr:hypothetical protein [Saccharopolyspora sp. S2-29]MEB3372170.1 hypothetical protein [Saccharopolyspora sp. S2-29]